MERQSIVYVAGHTGLIGSALTRRLEAEGYRHLVTRSHAELDLTNQAQVEAFFRQARPEYVFLAAGRTGGIGANLSAPADLIYTNLAIQTHVLDAAQHCGVKRLLFYASSCAYPREAPQPLREESLFGGPVEPSSAAYAMAKLAGITMCAAYNRQHGTRFLPVIPASVYGPGDTFDPRGAHVVPGLMRRFAEARRAPAGAGARRVVVWGTGEARREFLYVDDLADASLTLMRLDDGALDALLAEPGPATNVAAGEEITIRELALRIGRLVGFEGEIAFDASKPEGAARKVLDGRRLGRLGWKPTTPLAEGLRRTYAWYDDQPG